MDVSENESGQSKYQPVVAWTDAGSRQAYDANGAIVDLQEAIFAWQDELPHPFVSNLH